MFTKRTLAVSRHADPKTFWKQVRRDIIGRTKGHVHLIPNLADTDCRIKKMQTQKTFKSYQKNISIDKWQEVSRLLKFDPIT